MVPGCGKRGVWKTWDVENTGSDGKPEAWKAWGVENTGSSLKQWGLDNWKTWGQSEKHRGTIILPNNEFFSSAFVILNCNENHLA